MRRSSVAGFEAIVARFSGAFTAPTARVFLTLVRGWVQCLGHPTMRRLVAAAGEGAKSVWSCGRFFRSARWELAELWRLLVVEVLVPWFAPRGRLVVAGDDTTCQRFGKLVAFAAWFRNAAASALGRKVYHWAHCWVVLSLQVRRGRSTKVVSFPVMARVYRKGEDCDAKHPFRTKPQLVREMVDALASWLPDRAIELVVDGAYPCRELFTGLPPKVVATGRMPRRAALYDFPRQPRVRRRGRPREKGRRLPTPERMCRRARKWTRASVRVGDHEREVQLWTRRVLWWGVAKAIPVLLVISRDPEGKDKPLFLFTTDPEAEGAGVVESYGRRRGIEELFWEAKQLLGFQRVQGWRPRTVERQAPFALFVLSLVKAWYVHEVVLRQRPVDFPPTSAMLTALRLAYWRERIIGLGLPKRQEAQIIEAIHHSLSAAA